MTSQKKCSDFHKQEHTINYYVKTSKTLLAQMII